MAVSSDFNEGVTAKLSERRMARIPTPLNSIIRTTVMTNKNLRRLLIALTMFVVSAFTNSLSQAQEPKKVESSESHYAKLDDAKIHYLDYGKGDEAIVLIHGWTCNSAHWRDQIPDLSKRGRVIAVDLLGHGKSDKPQIKYSMDLFARVVDAVMRDAKVKRAVVVGHSMGTPVARQFYRKYPDKTIAIVAVDGVLVPLGNKAMMDQMLTNLRGPNYRQVIDQMFAAMSGPGLSAEAKERLKVSTDNTPQHVLVSAMEGMADDSIWIDDKINVPVLAIMAKNPFFPPDLEQSYRKVAPNLEYHMWEDVGHFLMMEKPKQFNDAVIAFLDKNKLLVR
jgi:pimeloyl-ACP methyl ester carboxylesterase